MRLYVTRYNPPEMPMDTVPKQKMQAMVNSADACIECERRLVVGGVLELFAVCGVRPGSYLITDMEHFGKVLVVERLSASCLAQRRSSTKAGTRLYAEVHAACLGTDAALGPLCVTCAEVLDWELRHAPC